MYSKKNKKIGQKQVEMKEYRNKEMLEAKARKKTYRNNKLIHKND